MLIAKFKLLGMKYRAEDDGDSSAGSGAIGTGNDSRLTLLAQINDANDAAAAEGGDLYDVKDDGTTEAFVVQKADGTKEALTDEAKHEQIVDHDADKIAADALEETIKEEIAASPTIKHKIKVNGVEQELTFDELVTRAQKVSSADQYLAEAARLRNEAATQAKPPIADASKQDSNEELLATARAIQMGSEEEAVAALQKIINKGPSQDDLAKTIDERLTFNEAIAKFRSDFKDLVSDPHLHKMVLDRDAELIRQGDRRPYDERYTAVGTEVRNWVAKFKPAVADTKPDPKPVVDKAARKAAAEGVPKAAGGKVPNVVDEDKEESSSDVIANMAASRGGPQWMRREKLSA
jgi:hypothetical protein